jgi:hypothetical protein
LAAVHLDSHNGHRENDGILFWGQKGTNRMDAIIITREQVKEAIVANKIAEQLDQPALSLEVLTNRYFVWLEDSIEHSLLADLDHWSLGPNGINTSALDLNERSDDETK